MSEVQMDTNVNSLDARELVGDCYVELALYTTKTRIYPSLYDGMKAVYRRVIYSSRIYSKKVKSAIIVGEGMKYHPHGDSSIEGVVNAMACQFNSFPLFYTKGNFGGLGSRAAASRYTECCLSDLAKHMYLDLVDEANFIDGEVGNPEPEYLPSYLPYSFLTGTKSIATAMPNPEIPALNVMDLIDFYIDTISGKDPKYPRLDYGEVIVECSYDDLVNLHRNGGGKIWFKGLVTQEDTYKFVIRQFTPEKGLDKILRALRPQLDQEIVSYNDESDTNGYRYVFYLDNPSKMSPEDLKNKIEKSLSTSVSYKYIFEDKEKAVFCGLDHVVKKSLGLLRTCVTRKYKKLYDDTMYNIMVLRTIEAFRGSGQVGDLVNIEDDEAIKLVADYVPVECEFEDNEIAKSALSHNIFRLTKSHADKLQRLESVISEYLDLMENPDTYLLEKYRELRKEITPLYNKRNHSIMSYELDLINKRQAYLDNDKIVVINDDNQGMPWKTSFYLLYKNGEIETKVVSSLVATEVELDRAPDAMTNDLGSYVVATYGGNHISVKKIENLNGVQRMYKPWDEDLPISLFTTSSAAVNLIDERGQITSVNLDDFIKSRVSKPIRATKYRIVDIKEITK